jgi:hypothetical protein
MSLPPVILVGGTWSLDPDNPAGNWVEPSGAFSRMLRVEGLTVLDPCRWSTDLGGLRDDVAWAVGGQVLADQLTALGLQDGGASVVSHSHGGQVVAEAAAIGVRFAYVVTLAMPVRRDLLYEYRLLRANARAWSAIYSLETHGIPWQALGAVRLTSPRTWWNIIRPVRTDAKPYPAILDPTAPTHQSLVEPQRWMERGWSRLLYGEGAAFDRSVLG